MKEILRKVIDDQEASVRCVPLDLTYEDADPAGYPDFIETASLFPNGKPWAICSNWVDDLQARLGSSIVVRFGFWGSDNPQSEVSEIADGHDFVVVDGRYIVDGWLSNVECLHATGVFDIDDDADLEAIFRFYGNPLSWEATGLSNDAPEFLIPQKVYERLEAAGFIPAFVPDQTI